jgi:hypothetical protein
VKEAIEDSKSDMESVLILIPDSAKFDVL